MKRFFAMTLVALIIPWQVANAVPALAAATVTVSPQTIAPGGSLTISGTQFPLHQTITVSINTQPQSASTFVSAVSNTAGNFQVTLQVPTTTNAGVYTASATAASLATPATATFTVTGGPQISLSP